MNGIKFALNRMQLTFAKRIIQKNNLVVVTNKSSGKNTAGGAGRELALGFAQPLGYKSGTSTDYEDPDYDMTDIADAYDTDSYVRQGVDKYVDQIFKEGYTISGSDSNITDYVKLRLSFMAEATNIPLEQFLIDIADDIVKFANCVIVKARSKDTNAFPQGINLTGINGADPVAGYYCLDPSTMKVKRDDHGTIISWKQESESGQSVEFKPEDVVHFYYKKPKGKAYGVSFLVPVLDDVKALRQEEENVLKMMYRNIYPFYHVKVGTPDDPGTKEEVVEISDQIENMDVQGGLVTSERVEVKPIASDKVIEASPYLQYMESRVFSGLGIPAIMFGRGNTANRSTGDNMTSEMSDRIRAYCKVIEMFFNSFVIKEILLEGGYDPILNPDQNVELKFNDNDVEVKIKKEVHAIYKYEHNAITEDEMRAELGKDPIEDSEREHTFVELITRPNLYIEYGDKMAQSQSSSQTTGKKPSLNTGTKETNNKEKNSGGAPKSKGSTKNEVINLIKNNVQELNDECERYISRCYDTNQQILQTQLKTYVANNTKKILNATQCNNPISEKTQTYIINCGVRLINQIHSQMIGTNIYQTPKETICDLLDVRFDLYSKEIIALIEQKEP